MADYRGAVLKHISIQPGLIQDRDAFLVEQAVLEAEAGYQPGTFDAYLGHCPEIYLSEIGYPSGEIIVFQ
jgi:hypothetical protein